MAKEQNTFTCQEINLETYTKLLEGQEHSLYFSPWWLATIQANINEGNFLYYLVSRKEEAVALFVALHQNKQIITADYCQHLGFHYLLADLTPYQKQQVCLSLHKVLPKHHYFHLNFSPKEVDWLAWHWLGYEQTSRYNYYLDISTLHSEEDFLASISKSLRKNLKASLKAGFTFVPKVSLEEAINIFSYNSEYKSYHNNDKLLEALIKAGLSNKQADLVGVADQNGTLTMAAFLVRCGARAYLIAEGCNRELGGKYQLKNVLLMNYILQAPQDIKFIDFEGSMIEPIAKIYQAMGAIQEPYFTIKKGNRYSPTLLLSKVLSRLKH